MKNGWDLSREVSSHSSHAKERIPLKLPIKERPLHGIIRPVVGFVVVPKSFMTSAVILLDRKSSSVPGQKALAERIPTYLCEADKIINLFFVDLSQNACRRRSSRITGH